jgi:hypothetical protein
MDVPTDSSALIVPHVLPEGGDGLVDPHMPVHSTGADRMVAVAATTENNPSTV